MAYHVTINIAYHVTMPHMSQEDLANEMLEGMGGRNVGQMADFLSKELVRWVNILARNWLGGSMFARYT